MKDLFNNLNVILFILAFITVFVVVILQKKKEQPDSNQPKVDFGDEEKSSESIQTTEVELKLEKKSETLSEMEARLKTIANPDQDKPFANLSKPTVSEVPDEIEIEKSVEIVPETQKPAPAQKPKLRSRASEVKVVSETSISELSTPVKKKHYPKKGPKKSKIE